MIIAEEGLSQKKLDFCELYVALGGNAKEAYRMVMAQPGTKASSCGASASLLLNNVYVRRYIAKIRTRHRRRHNMSIDKTTKMLYAAYDLAKDQLKPAIMAKIAMDLSKLHGLIIEKREIVVRNIDNMDMEELAVANSDLEEKILAARKRIRSIAKAEGETLH